MFANSGTAREEASTTADPVEGRCGAGPTAGGGGLSFVVRPGLAFLPSPTCLESRILSTFALLRGRGMPVFHAYKVFSSSSFFSRTAPRPQTTLAADKPPVGRHYGTPTCYKRSSRPTGLVDHTACGCALYWLIPGYFLMSIFLVSGMYIDEFRE